VNKEGGILMWTLIKMGLGLVVASHIADASSEYTRMLRFQHRKAVVETKLKELEAAKEVLTAYGYDKPRG
jgi:hypothetical protein